MQRNMKMAWLYAGKKLGKSGKLSEIYVYLRYVLLITLNSILIEVNKKLALFLILGIGNLILF